MWRPEERGKAVGIYSLGPLLGPAVGPVCAGFIAERTTWRWCFWSTSIAATVVQLSGIFWLEETYAPVLLRRKCQRLIKETGNANLHVGAELAKSPSEILGAALIRPTRMLATQPIVQVIAVYMGYLFGVTYLVMVTFPIVWTDVYRESLGISGLNYLSLFIGAVLAVITSLMVVDKVYMKLKARNNDVGRPEFRVPSMFVGSIIVPIGLFWYGWSVQARVHWIMPNIGAALFTAGVFLCTQAMQAYTIDSYHRYAASGLAAATVLRSLAGFGFPLFAPYLYQVRGAP